MTKSGRFACMINTSGYRYMDRKRLTGCSRYCFSGTDFNLDKIKEMLDAPDLTLQSACRT